MKFPFLLLLLVSTCSFGQKLKKQDKVVLDQLRSTIHVLAADSLEGRRTGTPGAQKAAQYVSQAFKKTGLIPAGDQETYFQAFEVNEGKQISPETRLSINGENLQEEKDFFPLGFSANGSVEARVSPAIHESNVPWFFDIRELLNANKDNPHFDLLSAIQKQSESFLQKGANAIFVYNSGAENDGLSFDPKYKGEVLSVPVVYITKNVMQKYLADKSDDISVVLHVALSDKMRHGKNVVGFIDNNAANTVVIGAHYDHLGYGEDHNSLWTGKPEIHNSADDNASGTAAVIELSRLLKGSKFRQNNYLFVCFSGEELGLYGSKAFVTHEGFQPDKINYMINMDMIGRLNPDSRAITLGGYGTSPSWGKLIPLPSKTVPFKIGIDSSGIGPSDHTSFYLKDIPVLFFFTGTHSDYHKPSDDADKINFNGVLDIVKYIYDLVGRADSEGKLQFTKTREPQMGNSPKFSVSMGVMPDYTYSGTGLHIDGVIEGKAADKAGIKTGDVILAIGDYAVTEINSYMTALSKFKKNDAAKVKVKRGDEELVFDVVF